MNCAPNELAIIVKGGGDKHCEKWVGRIVTVRSVVAHAHSGLPCWTYDEPHLVHPLYGECTHVADEALKAIRDPGDSATDETLVFAGKPQSREVA